jgi:NADH-quinone oxidoreductase subunit M
LFLICGVIHERMGTRNIRDLSGLVSVMPKTTFLLTITILAAIGFPSLSNFISEYMILLAAISVNMLYAIAVPVLAMTAGYFMLVIRTLIGTRPKPIGFREPPYYTLMTVATFLVPLLILGIYPAPLLEVITPAVQRIPFLR